MHLVVYLSKHKIIRSHSAPGAGDCGDPELPLGSVLEAGEGEKTGARTVRCEEGLNMVGGGGDNSSSVITCSHGRWNSSHIKCECKLQFCVQVDIKTVDVTV